MRSPDVIPLGNVIVSPVALVARDDVAVPTICGNAACAAGRRPITAQKITPATHNPHMNVRHNIISTNSPD
jgi:hypothetical protein